MMIGYRINKWLRICWTVLTPSITVVCTIADTLKFQGFNLDWKNERAFSSESGNFDQTGKVRILTKILEKFEKNIKLKILENENVQKYLSASFNSAYLP